MKPIKSSMILIIFSLLSTVPFFLSSFLLSLFPSSRFLTLLPPISVTVQLGSGNRHHPSPSPPTLIQSLLHTLTHTLSHPNTIRVIFVVAAMVSIVMYFAALVRSSQLRHKRHQESVMRKQYNAKIGHLRGHQQVRGGHDTSVDARSD